MRKLAALLLVSLCALAGCSSVVVISDSITPAGPVALDGGQSVTLTAAVTGDSSNSGVTWQLTGGGTLTNTTTSTTVYTAPTGPASSATVIAIPVKNLLYAAATVINYAPPPAITSTSLPGGTVGVPYSFQLGASGGVAPLTFSLVSGTLPTGLTLSIAGLISGTPTAPISSTLVFRVTDSAATPASSTASLTLNINGATLSIATAATPNGVATKPYSLTLATTGGVAPFTWSVSAGTLPAGLTLSTAGVLSGSPTTAGNYSFTVKVTDTEPSPQTATRTYTQTIYSPLTITTATLPGGSVKNAYSAALAFTGGTSPVTFSLASGTLPAGLTLSSTGTLSGTPTTAGSSTFTVQAADASSPVQTTTATYTVTIVLSTLAITTTTLPQATATTAYSTTLQSSGGNPPVTWSLAAGSALPAGLTLSTAGVLSGTPTTPGAYTFTVQATDSTPATVSQALTLNVVGLATLTITTTTLPGGNLATPYSTTLAATGGATPYTWSVATGTLPPGLTLSPAGVLSGTPVAAGSYTFTLQVKDSQATPATASRQFTVVIGTTLPTGTNNAVLTGSYGFLLNGFTPGKASGQVYGFASIGSLTFTAGAVTGVEDTNSPAGPQSSLAVTGSYTLGADNRGLLVITTATTTSVFAIAASNVVSGVAQSIALTEFDNSTGTGNTASGFARRQTAAAFAAATLKGTFAFGLQGESPCNTCATAVKFGPVAAAGVFSGDGTATLSAGQEDAGAYATTYTGVTLAGSYTAPAAATGRGTLKLTPTGTLFAAPPTNYTYIVISAADILLLSTDTHATTTLLYGDAQLQQQATYTTASFIGRSIGYESQATGGDGSTTFPTGLTAILSQLTNTAAGTATLGQDANRAGTFANNPAAAVTYTTATNGRTVIPITGSTTQVVYLYNSGAGFGLDQPATSGYPALLQYELQVATAPFPTLLSGSYAAATLPTPAAATDSSGTQVFTPSTGGVNTTVNGSLATTADSSTPAGALTLAQAGAFLYLEDATGREVLSGTTSTTPTGITYAITARRAVSIPATGTLPVVTVLQQ